MRLVPGAIGRHIAHSSLLAQKASPQMLLGAGIVGVVGSTVLACRATLKVDEVMDDAKSKLDLAKNLQHVQYSEKDRSRDISLIYFQTGVKVVRLYAPAILVGSLSIYALISSHRILTARNAALVSAYGALDKGFREYRARVVDKYGEDEDRNLRYGGKEVEIVDPKTDKKITVTRVDPDFEPSVYARFFDESSDYWTRDPEHNLFFLQCQQNWSNDLLKAKGHLFLNEVYDMLGIPRTKAGAVVGWVLSRNGETDDFVNFGVFDGREQVRDFVNGYENAILLDFNVDGVIYDKLSD